MVVVNFILQKKASFFNEFHYLKDFHLHKLFYTLKKWVVVIISLILIVAVIGVGGKVFISSQKESKMGSEKVKRQIAEEFATKYLAPDNKDVNEVVFYKEPVDQADFTGNRTYFFILMERNNGK